MCIEGFVTDLAKNHLEFQALHFKTSSLNDEEVLKIMVTIEVIGFLGNTNLDFKGTPKFLCTIEFL